MTALELATSMIDKLQEENRRLLDTLRKVQDKNKYYELRIDEKDRLIKVLEERLRTGTDGLLEMTNRQKGITISHLEKQIEQLLKKNENLEDRLEAIKAEICTKCETKLLLSESRENKIPSKSYKPPAKVGSLFEKKSSQTVCPNRLKNIVEHKDKRINQLSKEVQRLKKIEEELTQKVYRLSKLMPMSRLPPETITDCLLKEIQELESQKNITRNIGCDKFQLYDGCDRTKHDKFVTSRTCTDKAYVSKSTDRYNKSAASSVKFSTDSLPRSQQPNTLNNNGVENEVLFRKLQKLCNDVNELKRLFAFESEKLSDGLNSTASEYNLFKIHLEELIKNLNDVVQNILMNDFSTQQGGLEDLSMRSDDKCAIAGLQDRLKESLGIITEYEKENKMLKETLSKLTAELAQPCTCSVHRKSENLRSRSEPSQNIYATNLKESHIDCQNLIEEIRKIVKPSMSEKAQCCHANVEEEKLSSSLEQQNKILQTKLNVAEKNIKTCETVIEELQNSKRHLEEKNVMLESELHKFKSKAISEASDQEDNFLYTKMSSSDTHNNILKKHNEELKNRVKILEETNSKLETNAKFREIKDSFEAVEQEKNLLKSKMEASEKHICSLEKSVEVLQDKLKTVENEKIKLEIDLRELTLKNKLAETYEIDVMSLKAKLSEKEEENTALKESLQTLEIKTAEINHYRKSLHKEIENLCKTLMDDENIEDNVYRKAIYKAAVLHSAQALLRLDENYNLKPEDSGRNSALDEMKHQLEVYLTEVSRIHELVTIKEQVRDELLKEYLDFPEDLASLRPSPSLHHESLTHGQGTNDNLRSSPNLNPSEATNFSCRKTISCANVDCLETAVKLKNVQVELSETKTVTNFLLSNCSRLEDLLSKENLERAKFEIELQISQETVKDLNSQLNMKNCMTQRLHNLIETMRSRECSDEITHEQLKSEIKWLENENKKIFEKVTGTQTELCQCKEENCRIRNDLDSIKRQLLNKEYENARINNEIKHLRSHISNCQSTLHDI